MLILFSKAHGHFVYVFLPLLLFLAFTGRNSICLFAGRPLSAQTDRKLFPREFVRVDERATQLTCEIFVLKLSCDFALK